MPEENARTYRANVAVVVINANGDVLAGERAGKPGALQFPQGGIDNGESPLDAARRELWEETGLRIDDAPLHEIPEWLHYDFPPHIENPKLRKYRGQKQRWFVFRWDGDPSELDVDHHHREFDRLFWTDMNEVVRAIEARVPFKAPVYQRVAEELEGLIGPAGPDGSAGSPPPD